jgi:hypothetical protein
VRLGETSSTEPDAIRYLDDAEQVDVLDHIELGYGDTRLLLEFLGCLHISILDAVVQHEDEDVAAPLDLPLFLLASHTPTTPTTSEMRPWWDMTRQFSVVPRDGSHSAL